MSRYTLVTLIFLVLIVGSYALASVWHFPVAWYVTLIVIYVMITSYGTIVLSAQFFLPVRFKSSAHNNAIAVTFDDGPVPEKTERVLEILKQHKAPAAFFCIGHRASENGKLLKRIHDEGHLIGNHSYWHGATFDLMPSFKMEKEMADTDSVIQSRLGVMPRFFRPPYGVTNPMVAKAVRKRKYTVIGWSVRSFDTVIKDRSRLLKRVTRSLKAGDVVLFHDYSDSMLDILPDFLRHVAGLGLKIVRVDELLNEKAYV